jgi:hypothetical protein
VRRALNICYNYCYLSWVGPRTENIPKISLLKCFSTENLCRPITLLQTFLSAENVPECKWAFSGLTVFRQSYFSCSLVQDYVVMIPEDYHKATHLRQRVEQPCLVDSVSEFCVDYKYLTVAAADAVNVPTELGNLAGERTLLPYAPFKGFSVLNRMVRFYTIF